MRLGAAALAALAVVAVSCGGVGERMTYPEFQQAASGICLRYHERLAKLGAPTTLPRIARIARGAQRLGADERDALGQLEPPEEAAAAFDRMLKAFARADALLPRLARAAAKGDARTAQTLARRGRSIVRAANVDAEAIGLADCRRL
jgi:hypothetical protein